MRTQFRLGEFANAAAQELLIVSQPDVHEASRSYHSGMRRPLLLVPVVLLALASPAFADATLFVGNTPTGGGRLAKGFAVGAGLLIVAAEFEYSSTTEKPEDAAPSFKTGMGNLLLQTPFAIAGLQPYFTTGAGVYREKLGDVQETNVGVNTGGGVKISLLGPLRARVDYRVFTLRGSPLHDVVQRLYAGVNLKF